MEKQITLKAFIINAKSNEENKIDAVCQSFYKTKVLYISLEQDAYTNLAECKKGDFISATGYFLKGGRFVATNARYLKQAGKPKEAAATAAA